MTETKNGASSLGRDTKTKILRKVKSLDSVSNATIDVKTSTYRGIQQKKASKFSSKASQRYVLNMCSTLNS